VQRAEIFIFYLFLIYNKCKQSFSFVSLLMPSAYLLVSHGSQDPRPMIAMERLAALVSEKVQQHCKYQGDTDSGSVALLPKSKILVGTAYLELSPEPLHEQIRKFVKTHLHDKCDCLQIVPLFLLPGVHVMEDIPKEVLLAKQVLGEDMKVNIQPYLGSHPGLERLLAPLATNEPDKMTRVSPPSMKVGFPPLSTFKPEVKILVAHGSRRLSSQNLVEALARKLKAVTAYWSVSPSLESRVQELVRTGYKKITIIPYFLFPGGITDAIARKQQELELQFPEVSFQQTEPLGASPELATLIWDLIQR
jgi:sirohydrochlorin cobaltochelatase